MPSCKYLFDNDVIIKLAQYDLLTDLMSALSAEFDSTYVLRELRYVAFLDDDEKGKHFFGTVEALTNARQFYNSCQMAEIQDISIRRQILSLTRPGLDIGELVLLGCLVENDNSYLLTGDKHALPQIDSLMTSGEITITKASFIILEIAFRLLLSHVDFNYLSGKVRSRPDVDSSLTSCFGRSSAADKNQVIDGLSSYIGSLVSSCKNKLLIDS